MKVIIVGAHGEAKELINRFIYGWSISVIDLDQENIFEDKVKIKLLKGI